jgi:mannose-1-phosphate guanylyltransferase
LSRDRRPKPFLPLLEGGQSLLEATVGRLAPLIDAQDVYVITDARHAAMVAEVARDVPAANIIGEPMGRNTAAAVALAAHVIERPGDDVMVVLPADQAIGDEAGFRAALSAAAERAAEGDLVTLGVEPTEPATGYGYVVATGAVEVRGGLATRRVARFEEKPTAERAAELVASGEAYWNAGIFVWRRATLLAGLERHASDISAPIGAWLMDARRSPEAGWPGQDLAPVYAALRGTSIDYALLEPASLEGSVAVVPTAMGWSDLGSWSALRDHRGRRGTPVISAEGAARVIDVGSGEVLVHAAAGRLVAVVGLEGIVIVDTPDALLVSSVEAVQDVRKVVDRLRDEGHVELL